MIESKLEKVPDDDPARCQATYANGQCHHKRVEGTEYCPIHGGGKVHSTARAKIARQYNVAKWNARIGEFAGHDAVKTLREEIGIIRLLVETVLSQCNTSMDLLLYSSKISDLVSKVESLVRNCHKLESSMGLLLDKQAAMQLSGEIVEIISRRISDEATVEAIAADIANALVRMEGNDK